jgi:hypothetical protein
MDPRRGNEFRLAISSAFFAFVGDSSPYFIVTENEPSDRYERCNFGAIGRMMDYKMDRIVVMRRFAPLAFGVRVG